MKILITISDVFKSKTGQTVVAGINPKFDEYSNDTIKSCCIGKKIIKHDNGYSKIIEVEDVQITTSMWDKKNIFFLLSSILPIADIPKGSSVYYYKNNNE